jgi:uroporphyrinogen III methyltransferase/synthase
LAAHGIVADVVPPRFVAESLAQSLRGLQAKRALIARAARARDVLPEALRAQGAEVDVLALYETVAQPLSAPTLAAARSADYIAFTSSSTVSFFLDSASSATPVDGASRPGVGPGDTPILSKSTRVVSIGPVTSRALRERGIEPHVEAQRHDVDGLLEALLEDASTR